MELLIEGVELLSPVGSWEALTAAVQNGADAVYLGGKLFNARHYASNFSDEELMEAVSYAHLRGVRVFVTVNILIDDSEIEKALDYVYLLHSIGVDAIIVQDIGFASLIRNTIPQMEIHASTQMTINSLHGAIHLKELGFSRVVLARETSEEEIRLITSKSGIEIEAFIHGALCYSYSGQCLMSSLIGGRSGNRGTCAQPCRKQYSIVDRKGELLKSWNSQYFLSTRDLNTIEETEKLIEMGIKSFKIEGRMKRPEYVATITNAYREAIDKGSYSLFKEDKESIAQIFNRKFTHGLTFGDFGESFVSIDRPDNRGIPAGKILSINNKGTTFAFDIDIKKGDGLEWTTESGGTKGFKSPQNISKKENLFVPGIYGAVAGTVVNRTSSVELLEKAKQSYFNESRKIPVRIKVKIRANEFPKAEITDGKHKCLVYGESVAQEAKKAPLTIEKISEQILKLGGTVFVPENIEIDLSPDTFLPVSEINSLRRKATDCLEGKIIEGFVNIIPESEFSILKKEFMSFTKKEQPESRLNIRVMKQRHLDQLDLSKVDRIYLGFYDSLKENLTVLKHSGVEVFLWTDRILYQKDYDEFESLLEENLDLLDGISVSNLGSLQFFSKYEKKMHGDFGLNIFNSFSCRYFDNLGFTSTTLSPELNLSQMQSIAKKTGGNREAIVYGYLPSMIAKNCPMAVVKGCIDDRDCERCAFASGYKLRDKMNKEFFMERVNGLTTIYNSVPLMVPEIVGSLSLRGISSARLDFTIENEIAEIQSLFYDYLQGNIEKNDVDEFLRYHRKNNETTNGHFYRGVLQE